MLELLREFRVSLHKGATLQQPSEPHKHCTSSFLRDATPSTKSTTVLRGKNQVLYQSQTIELPKMENATLERRGGIDSPNDAKVEPKAGEIQCDEKNQIP
jgi:hypothetical protein